METTRIILLVCLGLAALFFMAASGLYMRKGFIGASTLAAVYGLMCCVGFVAIL